ncbi:MAG: HD-like signal output (HDOD) protein [Gammaproteobacteria bacterium]|jgi:HD-like signal output (HDOD) protein
MNTEANRPTSGTLRKIRSLELFSDEQLERLANSLEVKFARPNERIIGHGDSGSYSLYLLKGEAISREEDGTTRLIRSELDGVLIPVAQLRPSLYDVEAVTQVAYVEIGSNRLNSFSRQVESTEGEIEVTTIDQGVEVNLLSVQLFQDIIAGKITLPTMPDAVLKIQQAFADDNYNAESIRELIQSDPALSAKLLSSANSPLYRGSVAVESLQQAIVRMGMQTVRKQVLVYAASSLFMAKSTAMKQRMQSLWSDSRRVAAFSRVLAARQKSFDPETALIAGLLSDLGSVAILQYAQEHNDLYNNEEALDAALISLRPQISGMLLYKWNLGDELIKVGEESFSWFRNDAEQVDLCDLVMVARYFSCMGTSKMIDLPSLSKIPAFAKLALPDFSPANAIEFIKQSQADVAAVEAMLGSP